MRRRFLTPVLFLIVVGAAVLLVFPGLANQAPLTNGASIPEVHAGQQQLTNAGAVLVVRRLKTAGLPIDNIMVVDSADADPDHLLGQPGQYIAKATFHNTQLHGSSERSLDGGGSVEAMRR